MGLADAMAVAACAAGQRDIPFLYKSSTQHKLASRSAAKSHH